MTARKIRSDSTVGAAEKRLGIKNAIRNPDGSNARSDKLIGTLRKEAAKKGAKKASKPAAKKSAGKSSKKAGKK